MNATVNAGVSLDSTSATLNDSLTGDARADASLQRLLSLTQEQRKFYAHFTWADQEKAQNKRSAVS